LGKRNNPNWGKEGKKIPKKVKPKKVNKEPPKPLGKTNWGKK